MNQELIGTKLPGQYIQSFMRPHMYQILRGHPCKNQTKIQIVSILSHKQTLVRQERLCIFFHQICFYFREKRTFRFHPLESMDRVITGRKLNTFARFAFQRYYVQGNLTNVSSFIDSFSSVKCKLCRNWLLRSFQPCKKTMCSLPLQNQNQMDIQTCFFFFT